MSTHQQIQPAQKHGAEAMARLAASMGISAKPVIPNQPAVAPNYQNHCAVLDAFAVHLEMGGRGYNIGGSMPQ